MKKSIENLAIVLIILYQKYISPYKGYKCAYKTLHEDKSCSDYGKYVIGRFGILIGIRLLIRRFKECELSYQNTKLYILLITIMLLPLFGCESVGKIMGQGSGECCVGCIKGCK